MSDLVSSNVPTPTMAHDYLLVFRGAERTFAAMTEVWPTADVATLFYDPVVVDAHFTGRRVQASCVQRLNPGQDRFRQLLPLLPIAARSVDLSHADLVVSSSSAFAHGFRTAAGTCHVCYCHSPFRYIWHERARGLTEIPDALRTPYRALTVALRIWDRRAASRVTHFIANSKITQERIRQYWGRHAPVLHPPVDVARFKCGPRGDYALVVGELVKHKRTQIALEAAKRAGIPIVVVGDGPEGSTLREVYGRSATFTGRIPDDELVNLYSGARVVIVPNVEEFGIAAVEAQAAGRPVIGTSAGGTQETIIDGTTGVLVPPGDIDALERVLAGGAFDAFQEARIVEHAQQFSVERFKSRLRSMVADAWSGDRDAWSCTPTGAG